MLAGCLLDQPEHKVAFLERSWLDLPVEVSAQALLIDAVLTCFLCFLLGVHGDSRGVELYVHRDDGFSTVDEEERCEAG